MRNTQLMNIRLKKYRDNRVFRIIYPPNMPDTWKSIEVTKQLKRCVDEGLFDKYRKELAWMVRTNYQDDYYQ